MTRPRGLYTPVYQSLTTHRKTVLVAASLKIPRLKLVGHLVALWTWALANCSEEGGPIGIIEVGVAAEWPEKDAERFTLALVSGGFLDLRDNDYYLHEWELYGGKVARDYSDDRSRRNGKRQAYQDGTIDAVRARDGDACRYCGREVDWTDRKTGKGGCYDHVVPHPVGPFTVENLVVACRACNTKKRDRTPEQAGMYLMSITRSSNDYQMDHLTDETRRDQIRSDPPKPPKPRDREVSDRLWVLHEQLAGRITPSASDDRQFEAWIESGCTLAMVEDALQETLAWQPEKPWAAFRVKLGELVARGSIKPLEPPPTLTAVQVERLRNGASA